MHYYGYNSSSKGRVPEKICSINYESTIFVPPSSGNNFMKLFAVQISICNGNGKVVNTQYS